MARISTFRTTLLLAAVLCPIADLVAAEAWRSHLAGQTPLIIEKRELAAKPGAGAREENDASTRGAYEALPSAVIEALGNDTVEYESFVIAYPSKDGKQAVAQSLELHGLRSGAFDEAALTFASRERGQVVPSGRSRRPAVGLVREQAVPRLFLVRFAFPVRSEWVAELERCGARSIGTVAAGTLLMRAERERVIVACPSSRYVAWVDHYLSTDRAPADLLREPGPQLLSLQFVPGTDLEGKRKALPRGVVLEEAFNSPEDRMAYLIVRAERTDLVTLIENDPDLLTVSPAGTGELSHERQGQIIAGAHDGVALPTLVGAGYRDFLQSRGLLTPENSQIVAVIDRGYDDGQNPGDHHPDLEAPDRLDDLVGYGSPPIDDRYGHGTMVAGIIAGDGATPGSEVMDAQGYRLGSGIAPTAKLFMTHVKTLTSLTYHSQALNDARNYPDEAHTPRALIANHSWNLGGTSGVYSPVPKYESTARFFDGRVIDANSDLAGAQRMSMVFSAGNYAGTCNDFTWDSVSSPATAKNVITVGATESYWPTTQFGAPPLDCNACSLGTIQSFGRPLDHDADHVGQVASFSGRGAYFGISPSPLAHVTRIKPDLVAPGVRIASTVPYGPGTFYDNNLTNTTVTGCRKYLPSSPTTYHSYGTGTSFAAPVVSGALALKRKWFQDRGYDASPALLKAALIATADSLGNVPGQDHRPSPLSGWGRVNLNRLTDARPRWWTNDNPTLALNTGEARSWARTIDLGASDTYIVLAWSDLPTALDTDSQVPLVNDLALSINGGDFRGNMFNENKIGVDDGYSFFYSIGLPGNDTINNVEAVFIPAGTYASGQSLTITVSGMNVTQGPQRFSVYAYNVR